MRHIANILTLASIILITTQAFSEETNTQEVFSINKKMSELHSSFVGKTVTMTGAIGKIFGDSLFFKNDFGQFSVQFDAGREARKKVENCDLEIFGWANSECVFEVDAELSIEREYNFADGGELKLIVYNVRDKLADAEKRSVTANDGLDTAEPYKKDDRIIDDSGKMNSDVEQVHDGSTVGKENLPHRAILYEEGATAEDSKAFAGGTSWSLRNDNDSPIIIGRVEVPQRSLFVDIIIRKNEDSSLAAASHLVEISYQAPPKLVGGGIEDIPALLVKNSEEAQGELLASAGVKVSDNLFWLALSSAPENVVNNLKLLREGSWFDLPIRYKNDKRAIVTIEKGLEGEVLFAHAMEAWDRGN